MTRGRRIPILDHMLTNSLEAAAVVRDAIPAAPPAIRATGVRKAYGGVQALDGVDLTLHRGELLAMLGPNGAGKTTLLEILEGHRRADAGAIDVLGHDPGRRERALRERTGIVLQEEGLDPNVKVREAVELYGAAYPAPRPADEVLELVGLADRAGARAASLSGGQRRRLDLALGIAGDPELIFLDEPTTGFDPGARRRSWELISSLRSLGKTILLTTHYMDYMEEAQALADRVVVLAGGRVVAEGSPESLAAASGEAVVTYRAGGRAEHFRTATPTADLLPLLSAAAARGEELEGLTVTRPSLEDVYLQLTEEPA
jgi:ABC-2 type transport system ATP-binding protein